MKIEAVKMMCNIRDQMSLDIKGMTFEEEQDYLQSQIETFKHLSRKNLKQIETCRKTRYDELV